MEEHRRLLDMLRRKGFSSSTRLAVMIYLVAKKKAYFMDMARDLGLTPGNLWSHLEKLRGEGYIVVRNVIADRPRRLVVVTDKGVAETMELVNKLLELLNKAS